MNEYYRFLEPAEPFTTVDPRPYNREMRHIAEGFDKLPAASKMNTGTQYYARLAATAQPDVFRATFEKFPTSGKAGMRMYFILPVDPAAGDVAVDVAVGETIFGPFLIRTAEGQAYPEGTLRKGVVYETVFRDDNVMQLLGAGSTVISVAQISVSRIFGFADAAVASSLIAESERNEAQVQLDFINNAIMPEAQFQLSRVNFTAATYAEKGLVMVRTGPTNAPLPHFAASTRTGNDISTKAAGKAVIGHTHTYFGIENYTATTQRKGFVQLSTSLTESSLVRAATPWAVREIATRLEGRANLEHDHDFSAISNPGATETQAGVFALDNSIGNSDPSMAATAGYLYWIATNIPDESVPIAHTHPWSQIRPETIPPATADVASVVRVFNDGEHTEVNDALAAAFGNTIRVGTNDKSNTQHKHNLNTITDLPDPRLEPSLVLMGSITNTITTPPEVAAVSAVAPAGFRTDLGFSPQEGINSYDLYLRGASGLMMACYYDPLNAGISINQGQLVDTFNGVAAIIPCAADNTNLTTAFGPRGRWRALSAAPNKKNNYTYPTLWLYERVATS